MARLTVTEDFPTPPLPEAMVTTRVVGGISLSGACSRAFQRAVAMAADFSSWVISVQLMRTLVTAGSDSTRERTSFWIWARIGQPAVVRATVTVTTPSSATSAPLAMPSSTMLLPSSGSTTPRSNSITWSCVGRGVVGGAGITLHSNGRRRVNSISWSRAAHTDWHC